MPDVKTPPRFQVGDQVRLKFSPPLVGRIMEARFAPSRGRIYYRIHVPMDPEPVVVEVEEDEIEKT